MYDIGYTGEGNLIIVLPEFCAAIHFGGHTNRDWRTYGIHGIEFMLE